MRKSCPLVALGTDKPMLDFAQVIFFLTSTAMLLGPILHLGKALQVPTTRASYNQSYTYDLQGNLSKRGNQVFNFDQGNRLKSVPGIASYQYDGLGRRVKISNADGSSRIQVYSAAGQLLYSTQSGAPGPATTKYVYLHHGLIAEVAK